MGHAYNYIILDGEGYYSDLTWDQSNIKSNRMPLENFLISVDDFSKSHDCVGFNSRYAFSAPRSITVQEQAELFTTEVIDDKQIIEEMIRENYLSGFVNQYLEEIISDQTRISQREYMNAMQTIKAIEDFILQREQGRMNAQVSLGKDKKFVFETSNAEKLQEMKNSIRDNRKRRGEDYEH